jgi:AraC-like DNA-binding protein
MALMSDLHHIELTEQQSKPVQAPSRQEQVMKGFLRLVNEHATREHRLQFYADQLFLSANRLSVVVKEQSGETPIYWINRAIILQAKVLLKHSDLKNFEIADRLCFPNASFFNKFFKAQTGMTPKEYQES